ncbi:MAG TPA: tRNA pseudouridine(38-40) synthase TruA [Bacteriovoracaceae bacterium]|nr:tRNA pseudouridine(38-40) synthase TruA [Bacteriovoracaceae bacterium]
MARRERVRSPDVISHYRLVIEYRGLRYLGWQIQPETSGKTVQGELNKALRVISKSEQVRSLGAGRTDSGVHALGQVAKVSIPLVIDPKNLIRALNVNLPDDIRVLEAAASDDAFMPTVNAKSKEYHYRFSAMRTFNAFQNDFIVNYPFELDLLKMREACAVLRGVHDFTNYFCEGTEVSSYVREIFECEILEVQQGDWNMFPSHYQFRIVGNGFLKQMVRLLMGAIWNIGRGKITVDEFKTSLSSVKIKKLGAVAPPFGLYMVRVNY